MLSCHEYYTSLECSLASWPLNERYLFKLSKLKLPHKLSSGPTTQQYQHLLTIKVRRGPQMMSNPFKCDGWAAINKRGKPGYFTSGEDFFPVSQIEALWIKGSAFPGASPSSLSRLTTDAVIRGPGTSHKTKHTLH